MPRVSEMAGLRLLTDGGEASQIIFPMTAPEVEGVGTRHTPLKPFREAEPVHGSKAGTPGPSRTTLHLRATVRPLPYARATPSVARVAWLFATLRNVWCLPETAMTRNPSPNKPVSMFDNLTASPRFNSRPSTFPTIAGFLRSPSPPKPATSRDIGSSV